MINGRCKMLCPNCSRPGKPVLMYRVERKVYLAATASCVYRTIWVCPECGLEIEDQIQNVLDNIRWNFVLP